jgi:hypothetical protein
MVTIKGHFDGNAVVLDEPASLIVGQAVRVIVDPGDQNQALSAAARLTALSVLQQSLGLSDEEAETWAAAARVERAAWPTVD